MEPLRQELTIDSFSYNWLLNIKPSIDSLDDGLCFSLDFQDAGSFIEMDPKLNISMRWKADSLDFDFSLSSSQSPVLVHADHIFSNGLLLPLDHLINPPINELAANSSKNAGLIRSLSIDSSKSLLSGSNRFGSRYLYTVPSSPISLNSSSPFGPVQGVPTSSCLRQKQVTFLGGLHEVFQEVLPKVLEFSNASVQEVQGPEIDREGGKLSSEQLHGIDRSIPEDQYDALSSFECCHGRRTFDMGTENVIDDAIVHCKNSIR